MKRKKEKDNVTAMMTASICTPQEKRHTKKKGGGEECHDRFKLSKKGDSLQAYAYA